MLKLAMYEKRKFRGLFMYPKSVMKSQPLKLKHLDSTTFLCDYDIPDTEELRLYIGYFIPYTNNTKEMTVTKYKHLPIKPEDKNA